MSGIFKTLGVWSMGFDMDPPGAMIFTLGGSAGGGNVGSGSNSVTRFGTGYSWALNNQYSIIGLNVNLTTLIVGIAFILPSLPSTSNEIISFWDATASARQCNLRVYSDGHLQFCSGNTTTGIGSATAAGVVSAGIWYYFEAKVTINSTTGLVELRINGNATPVISSSSVDTQATSNTWVSGVLLSSVTTSGNTYYDDWYMIDTTGASPLNTYLGAVQCAGVGPNNNSAVSGRNAFTPTNPQNSNYLNAGNIPYNSSEYNFDKNVGDYDMFRFPSISAQSVLFLNEWVEASIDSAGTRTFEMDCYSSGVDAVSSNVTPSTTVVLYNQPFTVDPNTGSAWGVTAAGNAELGVKITA